MALKEFWLNQIAKFLVLGILNLGQGLFFYLGAYMMAMSLRLAAATSLQQRLSTPVPDFMFL